MCLSQTKWVGERKRAQAHVVARKLVRAIRIVLAPNGVNDTDADGTIAIAGRTPHQLVVRAAQTTCVRKS